MKTYQILGVATLFAATALTPVLAQDSTSPNAQQTTANSQQTATPPASTDSTQTGTYATGKPLETQSKEHFWGHVNPFARKKWVHRQINPIRDRANELDELQAKNANGIRDVDTRATAGINKAMTAASAADQHAADASNRANQANTLAGTADSHATTLNGTVQNLDQYSQVSAESLPFFKGRTMLTKAQKDKLQTMATSLANEKGYIVEVQGYSRSGVAHSQAMADSVVRYLVTDQNVPIYRIYRTGMGREKVAAENGERPLTNGVKVTVLHNSLASMGQATNGSQAQVPGQAANTTGSANPTPTSTGAGTPQ
jgi:outer membrane protein OmpA-like peptidoglycan-associated protein